MIPLYNRLVTVIPLLFCLSLSAQELTMDDIISMRKLPVERIDSIVRSKQFAQTKKEQDSGFSSVKYTWLLRTDTSLIQRTFTVGLKNGGELELQYAVYQQKDAEACFGWLDKNGFKKTITKMPDKDGKTMFEYTFFTKKNQSIGYDEKEYDSIDKKEKVYIFSVNTFDFP